MRKLVMMTTLIFLVMASSVFASDYTVVKDDSLSVIGKKLGIKWRTIAKLNNIKGPKYIIRLGQKLKIEESVPTR